jgi:myo-inositol 2-dehydrogenase/D-chiro-inositol 1-dehydrogenase/scyllo-inositol 2-dehydrogenase (NAD+)
MAKKRLCMVGAGRVGRLHTRNITERVGNRAEVTAIVDPDRGIAEGLAADYDVSVVCSSLDKALERGVFDGVVITTPTFTHHPLAVRALDAGLPVHLEKPMAMNLRECADISAAAERAGAALQVGFMRRFDHDFTQAAELLRSGAIGAPVIIKSLTHGPGLPPPWANDIRTSNGMLAEVNSHDLDTVSWFADSAPVDIHLRVANFKGSERGVATEHFYDTMLATITFESGALASIAGVCPADYGYDARVEVTCTGGMVQVGETGPAGLASISAGQARRCAPVFASWRDRFAEAYVREMVEFVAATDGAPVRVGAQDGTRAVALVLAGTLSMLEERTVSLTEVTAPAFVPSWQAPVRSEA